MNQASAYLVLEWTPIRWLSVGTGAGADWIMDLLFMGSCPAGSKGRCGPDTTWTALSVPLILAFQLVDRATWDSPRAIKAFRVGLEAAGGLEAKSGVGGWHLALSLGFVIK
jgi:hypothetical protein